MTTNRPLRVFLCHSSNDKPAVRELYQKLRAETWIEPWLDEEELYPGQDWNMEIEKAVEVADVILVCLSQSSITKEGYIQREIRTALDYADYKPDGTLFIIPIRLEECTPPKRLARWQYADYFEGQRDNGLKRLLTSLNRRANSLGLKNERDILKPFDYSKLVDKKSTSHSISPTYSRNTHENKLSLKRMFDVVFILLPNTIGQFILDIFGRASASTSTQIIMGYLVIVFSIFLLLNGSQSFGALFQILRDILILK